MRKRTKIALLVFLGLAGVWLLGDLIYSSTVAYRVKKWEASVDRDDEGVQQGCRAYTIGSGPTAVLLIHGINDSPRCFHRMAPVLAKEGFTCRVMRLPGFAQPIERYSQATKEEWLAAVKREIHRLREDHRRVAIVAHSLGGAVAIACLLENPKAVDAVVLLAPAVDVSNLRSPLFSTRTWHEIGSHSLWFTKVTNSPFPNDCRDPAQREYPGRTAFMPIAIAEQTFQLIDANRGRAAEFETPLMMVLAKDDQVIDWQAAQRFYQQVPVENKVLYFVKDAGHAIPVDYGWESLTHEIAAFLRR